MRRWSPTTQPRTSSSRSQVQSTRECFTLVRHTTRVFQSVMAVDDLETIDFGRYICRAKNKHGEIAVATSVHSNKLDSKREHLEPV
ncbi:hypothetical protein J4Q44_G00312370 [Coregonus suidteri]|uniref:Immunoglobulin I-set domain-containing protein n=1 Tax=Coregonus suidteri TaxID=861788 RepID=A0AAN8KVD5_9TELE